MKRRPQDFEEENRLKWTRREGLLRETPCRGSVKKGKEERERGKRKHLKRLKV